MIQKPFVRLFVIMFLAMILVISSLSACDASTPDVPTKKADEVPSSDNAAIVPSDEATPAVLMPVLDQSGTVLGQIDSRAVCSAADDGIFYSVSALAEFETTATAEYRFFNKNDHTDVLLGKFEKQGYEADYTRTELNGTVYTLAVQGVPSESAPLFLLAFDLSAKSMKMYTVTENGFPYADMAAVNGKLLIMNHDLVAKKDMIYEFDPAAGTVREALSFSSDADSLRGVATAADGFYLLRLKIKNGGENEMFIDRYDKSFVKTSEQSVNEFMATAIETIPGMLGRQDALNEIGMNVAHFSVVDDRYLFYENFGMARLILDLSTGESLLAKEDLYAVSIGNGRPVVYRMDFDDSTTVPEIIGVEDGKLSNVAFQPTDNHKLVRTVSGSAAGTWVVVTSDDPRSFVWTLAVTVWSE